MTTSTMKVNNSNKSLDSQRTEGIFTQPTSDEIPYSFLFTNIKDHIDEEIKSQLAPLHATQRAIIDQTAEISLKIDTLESETKNYAATYLENEQLKKRLVNITKILSFKNLEPGWNGKGSESFSDKVLNIAMSFINLPNLKYQPSVFPTGRLSIQFEYEKSNGNYLEIEAFEDHFTLYSEIDNTPTERENLSIQEILVDINAFHSRI
jgi:hypothetical protein